MTIVRTSIDISAPPMGVWSVLVDFAAYEEWNPFMVRGAGEARVGAKLDLSMRNGANKVTRFRPTVLVAKPGEHLAWIGRLGLPKIFDGQHEVVLTKTASGTRLEQFEKFSGILPPLMKTLASDVEKNFTAYNEALAERVLARG